MPKLVDLPLLQSTDELNRRLAENHDPSEIGRITKGYLAEKGLIPREDVNGYGMRVTGQLPAPAPVVLAPQPADDGKLLRRAVTLKDGTIRLLEAYSTSGLDILERHLKDGF